VNDVDGFLHLIKKSISLSEGRQDAVKTPSTMIIPSMVHAVLNLQLRGCRWRDIIVRAAAGEIERVVIIHSVP